MKTNKNHLLSKKIFEIIILFSIIFGILLIGISYIPNISDSYSTLMRGIGLSVFPAGFIAILLNRYAGEVTEQVIKESVDLCVGNNLNEHMSNINEKVKNGLDSIDFNIKNLAPVFLSCTEHGVESVHLNRVAALEKFAKYLDLEVSNQNRHDKPRIWIISSSIKGFLNSEGNNFSGKKIMEHIATSKCDIRIVMTDPKMADIRAQQEGRADGEIPNEIEMNIARLKRIGIKKESLKYYPGTPTVFAIATSNKMLLNPYPYEAEAFGCFSIIVYKTTNEDNDIFHQYLDSHFEKAWNRARPLTKNEWDKLK